MIHLARQDVDEGLDLAIGVNSHLLLRWLLLLLKDWTYPLGWMQRLLQPLSMKFREMNIVEATKICKYMVDAQL